MSLLCHRPIRLFQAHTARSANVDSVVFARVRCLMPAPPSLTSLPRRNYRRIGRMFKRIYQ